MIGYGNSIFLATHGILARSASGGGVDPDAQAFITAAAITNPTQQAAINQLVVDLKGYSIWTKMKALYPFVGGTASSHKFNLKDPRDLDAAFRLVFSGGWTHSSTGALPNGTNAYANSFLIPSFLLTFSSGHYSLYIRSNINESKYDMAVTNISSGAEHSIVSRWTNIFYHSYGLPPTYPQIANTDSRGHFITNRNSATNTTGFKNGVNVNNTIQPAITPPNINIYIGARNEGGTASLFSSKQFAFSSIGDGLTDTEAANFYTAVQAFQTTLGRSIGTQTVSDADAQAFVTNAGIVDQVEANAINNLVIGMKADGLWTKMKAVYPFVGGTATSHKFNLKDPRDLDVAFRLFFSGGWLHTSTGAKPNGTNGYADTFFIPSANQTINSNGLGCYITANTFTSADAVTMGSFDSAGQASILVSKINASSVENLDGRLNANSSPQTIVGRAGSFDIQRTSATVTKLYKNASIISNFNSGGTALPTLKMYIGNMSFGLNVPYAAGYTNSEFRLAYTSDGLTDTDITNLRTAIQAFQTSLSRNI
jgi:hypothetical protein